MSKDLLRVNNPDRSLRNVVAAASLVVGVMVLATIPLIFIATAKPAWFLLAFEVIMPVPVVLGLLFGRGRWHDVYGLGLACIAGTILFGSILGYLSIPEGKLGVQGGAVGLLNMKPWLIARVACALLIAGAAVHIGLRGDPGRWKTFGIGIATGGAALGIMAALYKYRGAPWMTSTEGSAEAIRIVGLLLAGVVMLVGACAGVHFTVKAFDHGVPRAARATGSAAEPGTAAGPQTT